ncbi:glucuronate isomerase [Flavobacterium fryxellicola]|uniref:Uronate isomerase n=1 Tax=Flavobacterium fryxellicola TaxID=249352 RepID=A0A167U7M3_9FLAO|nr:glucuronate isomerase [Flavobacterium fryxellicola]OAB25336.1 uronate isomerase [Flavobacterium fryxellicola]
MSNYSFLGENYFLENSAAIHLFHNVAKDLPIIDYHNHLNINHLLDNQKFDNIAQVWVVNDPYKHRAMRIEGVPEYFISGNATDKEKFMAWANVFPQTIGNPLFHWSCLELKKIFGIDYLLNVDNAEVVWNHCNKLLETDDFRNNSLLDKFNVDTLCTSDDWFDDLSKHKNATENANFIVLPSLRSDAALNIEMWISNGFIERLEESTTIAISSLEKLQEALEIRIQYFNENGCNLADQALDSGFKFRLPALNEAQALFKKWLLEKKLTNEEVVGFKSYILNFIGKSFAQKGWTLQLHIGAHRFTSSRLRELAGSAGGYAAIGNTADISGVASLLDSLEKDKLLPNIILFTLNPADNSTFATLTGSFSQDNVPAKVQFGPAWWYNDHFDGIKNQIIATASYSILHRFIGMTTDSRSILSFSRHDYFRRILCNIIGEWVEKGLVPNDEILLKNLVTNICYTNSKNMIENGK